MFQLVLPGMKSHPRQLGVQMAATACLYNLTKGELGPKIHPACLQQIVALTLDAMENFPNHQQVCGWASCVGLFLYCVIVSVCLTVFKRGAVFLDLVSSVSNRQL